MKDTWFFFPLGHLLRAIGGIPVSQHKHTDVTSWVVRAFEGSKNLAVAVTPEGTRSANAHWHKGFLHIARAAGVPVILAYIDYKEKVACLDRVFTPGDDVDADMKEIKEYYKNFNARYPEKFTTGL